jgi:hypothetical protein
MFSSSFVNSLGLVADIIGALMLTKFGLSPDIDPQGRQSLLLEDEDQEQIAKGKVYKRWSRIAIWLIVLGFVIQLISDLI